jgi:hypothetical protein
MYFEMPLRAVIMVFGLFLGFRDQWAKEAAR